MKMRKKTSILLTSNGYTEKKKKNEIIEAFERERNITYAFDEYIKKIYEKLHIPRTKYVNVYLN